MGRSGEHERFIFSALTRKLDTRPNQCSPNTRSSRIVDNKDTQIGRTKGGAEARRSKGEIVPHVLRLGKCRTHLCSHILILSPSTRHLHGLDARVVIISNALSVVGINYCNRTGAVTSTPAISRQRHTTPSVQCVTSRSIPGCARTKVHKRQH